MKPLVVADLFCGAGGSSTGLVNALKRVGREVRLTAVNHWDTAIATHTANHPTGRHYCASLDSLNPTHLFAEDSLDLLWASPSCTHHSVARGGKPVNDQLRATAWCVTRWAEALRPKVIFVENVPEFLNWGPIGTNGKPLATGKGKLFRAWVAALEATGYKVGWRVLCAADYGAPTTRERLFIQAVRGRRKLVWPEPSHSKGGVTDLLGITKPWVPARDIIDWSIPGTSIYERKKPLKPKTLARIEAGLRKFGLQPQIMGMEHQGSLRRASEPLPTITTAKGGAMAVIQSFLLPQQSDGALRPLSEPSPTVSTAGAIALVEPFLVKYFGTGGAVTVDAPLDSVTTKERFGLVRPTVRIAGANHLLDIRFRMLQPHELAAAQSFPRDYVFTGTKTAAVKQIGNAVPPVFSDALATAHLTAGQL